MRRKRAINSTSGAACARSTSPRQVRPPHSALSSNAADGMALGGWDRGGAHIPGCRAARSTVRSGMGSTLREPGPIMAGPGITVIAGITDTADGILARRPGWSRDARPRAVTGRSSERMTLRYALGKCGSGHSLQPSNTAPRCRFPCRRCPE
jgi:hypothetical protein